MHLQTEKIGNVSVGRIMMEKVTSHETPDLKTALLELIVSDGEQFLINLSKIKMMDSTGLGALIFGVRQADQHEKDLRFCDPSEKIQFLIRIAHLEDAIDVYDTEQEGLDDFIADFGA
ncbi:STAS domain-containing protein [candidate division KSB1 bacterium]|nr:STAS domain-containing protein [candidate division KSB1 bacterium]